MRLPRHSSPWRRGALACACLASFVATSAAVRGLAPWPDALGVHQKVEHVERFGAAFDLLFVGSSYVARLVDPRAVDSIVRVDGRPLRSFNLGLPAMGSFEADRLLRHLLDDPPPRLRWVVVEPDQWFTGPPNDAGRVTRRNVAWHDLRQTRNVLMTLWREDTPLSRQVAETRGHLGMLARHLTSYGLGPEIALALLRLDEPERPLTLHELVRAKGFQPLEALPSERHRHEEHLENPEAWAAHVRAMLAPPHPLESASVAEVRAALEDAYPVEAVLEQVAFLRERDLVALHVVPPRTRRSVNARLLYRAGALPTLLAFDDPRRFPHLYRPDLFFDLGHLGRRGARLYSLELGAALPSVMGETVSARPPGEVATSAGD